MMTEQEIKIKEAIEQLSNAVNVLGSHNIGKVLSKTIQKQHRTLQQSIWRAIFQAILDYKNAQHDTRNSASVKACGYLTTFMNDSNYEDFFLPFI